MNNTEKNTSLLDDDVLDAYDQQTQAEYAVKKSKKGGKKKRRSQDLIDNLAATEAANRQKKEILDPIARLEAIIENLLLHDQAVNRKHILDNLRLWLDPRDRKPSLLPHLNSYLLWLDGVLNKNLPLFTPNQLKETFAHSGGPGGQNVNKTNSAVDLLHQPTLLQAHSETTRDQSKNRQLAQELLTTDLQEHLTDWQLLIKSLSPDSIADYDLIITEKIKDQVRAFYNRIKSS